MAAANHHQMLRHHQRLQIEMHLAAAERPVWLGQRVCGGPRPAVPEHLEGRADGIQLVLAAANGAENGAVLPDQHLGAGLAGS
jgi:hypothetical protein